ncbi:hypothetical protein MCORR_v1c04260 [Mesoplasma corruscae]|uniref:Uncharacterized protein n=1 Tax=Mesoplasma corruscae TaxID=216874 RepID=A0A2S5RI07_9MOLU|nr:hypothetical protein MCORR_v1c04260 [Mesoplasma corruscae]
MRIAGGGSALPPGTVHVGLIIETITLYAPELMAAI